MSQLEQILRSMTSSLIVQEEYFDFLTLNSVNPDSWPKGKTRSIAEKYFELRVTSGHAEASAELIHDLDYLLDDSHLPHEPSVIIAMYWAEIKKYHGKLLAAQIAKDPENFETYLTQKSSVRPGDKLIHFGASIEDVFKKTVLNADKGLSERSIKKWPHLSTLVSGFNPERLGIVLAATGFGKTTLATNLALSASETMSVVYFNMEMSTQDFAEKMILSETQVHYASFKQKPKQFEKQVASVLSKHLSRKFYFSNGKTLSVTDIIGQCKAHSKKHGLDFVVIDYDQKLILQNKANLPEWRCLQIAIEQFEEMAKQLQCFVLVLAQENKEGGISGSMRAAFPATFVLRFYESEDFGATVIEAIKNRFGKKNSIIQVNYKPEISAVDEIGPMVLEKQKTAISRIDSIVKKPKPIVRSFHEEK